MKIAHICPFSSGSCGVWFRAKQEAQEFLLKGYDVEVFSTNIEKGTEKILPLNATTQGIKIHRFPAKKLGGESFMFWNFEKELLDFSPEIIIAHNYRHIHTLKCLKVRKKLKKQGKKCKVFLVTHAPFVEGNITRTFLETLIVKFYDKTIGKFTINKFDKILPISNWEISHLEKIGAKKEKIVYIPNGIPDEFFTQNSSEELNKILFLGRIAPKKKIETIINAIPLVKNKKIKFEIVGPLEEEDSKYLKNLISEKNLSSRISFTPAIYDLREKIKKLDSAKIYIIASRVEGMPQGTIEAMARKKIVIGSNSIAIRDLIKNKKNGLLFEFDNPKDLAKKINFALDKKNSKKINSIKSNARKSVEKFKWEKIVQKIERLIKK